MSLAKQNERIHADVREGMRPFGNAAKRDVDALLSDWRARWTINRQWGSIGATSLPALTATEASVARDMAYYFYWDGHFVIYGDYKRLLEDCLAAIADAVDPSLVENNRG